MNQTKLEMIVILKEIQIAWSFLFEVNDTGKGIPKEEHKSVIGKYVQVKETALGQEGTGLGLGIVRSLVRLMGGEIEIVDKAVGERGTCFRFSVLLCASETNIEANGNTFQLPISPKTTTVRVRSQVVLVIQSAERRNVVHNFMLRRGLKDHQVPVVNQHTQLSKVLKRLKCLLNRPDYTSSSTEGTSTSDLHGSSARFTQVPLSTLDGANDIFAAVILIIIDTSGGPYQEISTLVTQFTRELNHKRTCRIVWLNTTRLSEDKLPHFHTVITKSLHGSRLHQIINLLPEFGANLRSRGDQVEPKNDVPAIQKSEIQQVEGGDPNKPLMMKRLLIMDDHLTSRTIATRIVQQLGTNIDSCENGEEAWKLVCTRLEDASSSNTTSAPFDSILRDCEMNVMGGSEATAKIRKAEERFGIRIPIIALTAMKQEKK